MADKVTRTADLVTLGSQAKILVSAARSLPVFFESQAILLKRLHEVGQLKALRSTILQRVQSAREKETSAQSVHVRTRAITGAVGLGGMLVGKLSENKTLFNVSRNLVIGPDTQKGMFGTVLIRITLDGLPDGVDVVCISELARQSSLTEDYVRNELLQRGSPLYGVESFCRLLDKVAEEVLRGNLELPVPLNRLPNFTLTFTANTSWVAVRHGQPIRLLPGSK